MKKGCPKEIGQLFHKSIIAYLIHILVEQIFLHVLHVYNCDKIPLVRQQRKQHQLYYLIMYLE